MSTDPEWCRPCNAEHHGPVNDLCERRGGPLPGRRAVCDALDAYERAGAALVDVLRTVCAETNVRSVSRVTGLSRSTVDRWRAELPADRLLRAAREARRDA